MLSSLEIARSPSLKVQLPACYGSIAENYDGEFSSSAASMVSIL